MTRDDQLLERFFESVVAELGLVEPLSDADKQRVYQHVAGLKADTSPLGWAVAEFHEGRRLYLQAQQQNAQAEVRAKQAIPFVFMIAAGLCAWIIAGYGWLSMAMIYCASAGGLAWVALQGTRGISRTLVGTLFVAGVACVAMSFLAPSIANSWPAVHSAIKGAGWVGLALAAYKLINLR